MVPRFDSLSDDDNILTVNEQGEISREKSDLALSTTIGAIVFSKHFFDLNPIHRFKFLGKWVLENKW